MSLSLEVSQKHPYRLKKINIFSVPVTGTCVMWSWSRAACVAWSRCVASPAPPSSSWPCADSTRTWRRAWHVSGCCGSHLPCSVGGWQTSSCLSPLFSSFSRRGAGSLLVCGARRVAGGPVSRPCRCRWQGKSSLCHFDAGTVPGLSNIIDGDYMGSCVAYPMLRACSIFPGFRGNRVGRGGGVGDCGLSRPFIRRNEQRRKRNCWQQRIVWHAPSCCPFGIESVCGIPFFPIHSGAVLATATLISARILATSLLAAPPPFRLCHKTRMSATVHTVQPYLSASYSGSFSVPGGVC